MATASGPATVPATVPTTTIVPPAGAPTTVVVSTAADKPSTGQQPKKKSSGPQTVGDARSKAKSTVEADSVGIRAIAVEPDLAETIRNLHRVAKIVTQSCRQPGMEREVTLLYLKELHTASRKHVITIFGSARSSEGVDLEVYPIHAVAATIIGAIHPVNVDSEDKPIMYVEPAYIAATIASSGLQLVNNATASLTAFFLGQHVVRAKLQEATTVRVMDLRVLDLACIRSADPGEPKFYIGRNRRVTTRDAEMAALLQYFVAVRHTLPQSPTEMMWRVEDVYRNPVTTLYSYLYQGDRVTTTLFNPSRWFEERLEVDFAARGVK